METAAEVEEGAGSGSRSFARQTTQEVQDYFHARIRRSLDDLAAVTGEAEDVERDADFSNGIAHLTFKDVGFSLPRSSYLRHQESGSSKGEKGLEGSSSSDGRKTILAPISGHYEPGKLVALMGPSGSGKTTLLDILAGKKAASQGTIHVNGRPRDVLWNRISAYVPQDDQMFAHLTVEEVLRFNEALKMPRPSRITRSMAQAQEEKMLKVFGLYDIRKSWVGDPTQGARGISGGQRRRLSLARSIACGARIMFCDEPTSGLSATDAEHVVRYLRLLSHKYSVLIIMSIHQPRREVARLFDELILLTSNPGRAVYQGPLSGLSEFAEKVGFVVPKQVNPTDRVMDLITPGTKSAREQDFIQYFSQKQQPILDEVVDAELRRERQTPMEILHAMREPLKVFGTLPTLRHSKYAVSFRRQLSVVAARQFRLRCRDKMHFLGDLAGAIAKALLFILAYYEIGKKGSPLQAGYFFFVLMASSIDQVKTMPKIISERTIMKLETSEALYSEWAYILPFTFMSMLQVFVTHAVFMSLMWPFMAFPWALFWHVWFWSLMVNAVMESLYMMLSGIAKDATSAQVMSLPFLLLFMLYNGFTVTIQTCPKWLAWAIDISPVAYAMEAMTVAAAEYCVPDGPPCGQDGLYSAIVPHFGYKNRPKQALSVMCACMIIFRAVHVLALKFLNNIKR